MIPDWLNSVITRIVQDVLTSLAAYLTASGFLTPGSQEQGFIGASFFLVMLVINIVLHKARAASNQMSGASDIINQQVARSAPQKG